MGNTEYYLKIQKTGWLALYVRPTDGSRDATLVGEYRSFDGLLKGLQEHNAGEEVWIRLDVGV